jgi:rare lipoprotein A
MRLDNLRAPLPGALFGTTLIAAMAAVPAVASSDTQSPQPAQPVAAPATATPVATKASSALKVDSVRRTVLAGKRVVVRGRLTPAGSRAVVSLQVRKPHDRTDGHGRYVMTWRAQKTGEKKLRVGFGGSRALGSTRRVAGTTRIYRRAFVSWYGPGLYGGHLACGGTLSPGTLGVANKSLPCGTKVTLHYKGRTVRVPVVDRGPYVAGREYDLTAATKQKLGFGSTGTVLTTR